MFRFRDTFGRHLLVPSPSLDPTSRAMSYYSRRSGTLRNRFRPTCTTASVPLHRGDVATEARRRRHVDGARGPSDTLACCVATRSRSTLFLPRFPARFPTRSRRGMALRARIRGMIEGHRRASEGNAGRRGTSDEGTRSFRALKVRRRYESHLTIVARASFARFDASERFSFSSSLVDCFILRRKSPLRV